MPTAPVLTWLHVGDLHVTEPDQANIRDLARIVSLVNRLPDGGIDMVVLPGDNADDGTPSQFHLVRSAIGPLRLPVHILPGDHDFKPRSLQAFHANLGARPLPYAEIIQQRRCLFLDVVSAGGGGPDFRIDSRQLDWVEEQVRQAYRSEQDLAIFMHTYPSDLREGAERLNMLLADPRILAVDMGHTHYNELANDGRTIFMAVRSTGQIEEGPAGFAVATIDGRSVAWRFKTIDDAWPMVIITSPTDHRLRTDASDPIDAVRAKVLSDATVERVEVRHGDHAWSAMQPTGEACVWQAPLPTGSQGSVAVRAIDAAGREDIDIIQPVGATPRARAGDGSDRDTVGAWPEKHLLGTQLGPNRNGRTW